MVSGVSGSGKTTMALETLVPALRSAADGTVSPSSIRLIDADGISKVELIDATPIGANIRSDRGDILVVFTMICVVRL